MPTLSGRDPRTRHAIGRPIPARAPRMRSWNRNLHSYIGLYFLFFLLLFSLSGLLMNHSSWKISQFWENRAESEVVRSIHQPRVTGDVAVAEELMRQLGIVGEIGAIQLDPSGDSLGFQVARPGTTYQVSANLAAGRATVKEIRVNAVGAMTALHRFTGVKMDAPSLRRDWLLTRLWIVAVDGLAIGMIVLVLTGIYLWYRRPKRLWPGVVALALGTACCALFVAGLGLLR